MGLPRGAEALLRDLIHERTGLFFDDGKCDLLMDKLSPLVIHRGFTSFLDYYYLLKYDPEAALEWSRVMDALSVQETYFWREIDQIRALVEVVVPQLATHFNHDPLRIWTIPCATGEEPLTIAMMLNEAGWFDRLKIEITADDASANAIEKAHRGRYRERAFRNLPAALRAKYFRQEGEWWQVIPELHRRISWRVTNLVNRAEMMPMPSVPVIFCRNLFIYFSDQMIRRTVSLFAEKMTRPGYLCVSASESLLRQTEEFVLQEIGGAFMYVTK